MAMTKENTYKSTCSLTKLCLLPFIKTKLFNKYFTEEEGDDMEEKKKKKLMLWFFFSPFNNKN